MSPLFSGFRNLTPEILSVLSVVREPCAAPKMYIDGREPRRRCLCVNLSVYFFSCGSSLPPKQCLERELCESRTVLLESALSIWCSHQSPAPFYWVYSVFMGHAVAGSAPRGQRFGMSGGSLVMCCRVVMGCRRCTCLMVMFASP